jgi:hypothetical protein
LLFSNPWILRTHSTWVPVRDSLRETPLNTPQGGLLMMFLSMASMQFCQDISIFGRNQEPPVDQKSGEPPQTNNYIYIHIYTCMLFHVFWFSFFHDRTEQVTNTNNNTCEVIMCHVFVVGSPPLWVHWRLLISSENRHVLTEWCGWY